ncbi:sugar phosphate permease [Rhodococcus rhodochrous J45]|uniref:Putative proline/betaine transporter n=1 Tax=Rhodococcus rhodochrous J45 TaxID=935266 RepID=A0A562E2D1_RHORH|nr:MFS transporter [Rhodococcus rhodochrous]TWH16099.1 sugar phosphate permease [Rhodococcus rhodochrous J45]
MTTNPTTSQAVAVSGPDARDQRRAYTASLIGSIVEFYDFAIYGTAASLVFGSIFFAGMSPAVGTIASLATFAAGYMARPLGGVIFGHFGDKVGRKSMLMITLIMMGTATMLIGLLPTSAQIGSLAPVLLVTLRLIQGIAVGGEWGGAVLMSVETGSQKSRGFFGSATGVGAAAGALLATGSFALLGFLEEDQFMSWGWRIPFLASATLIVIGAYIRLKVSESPVFKAAAEKAAEKKETTEERKQAPFVNLIRNHPKRLALAVGVYVGPVMAQSIIKIYVVSWATTNTDVSRGVILNALTASLAVMVVGVPLFAMLSDRIGRLKVYVPAAILFAIASFLIFPMIATGSTALVFLAFFMTMGVIESACLGPVGAILTEAFPTKIRYTGTSFAYQVSSMVGGGFGPVVAALLATTLGMGALPVSLMMGAFCVISAVSTLMLGESRKTDLNNV